ncbi:hypothetical protein PsorP6_016568 [Peronosclerospora sorghi]|uniref:Uncharacterized protein n=1 Tax=Peronosclerospora sorghi TaxID=230839 RepID=A0ACC0VJA3_9STRA|nr:hypothetical protein PsorP6_016568 [Peronosclerospora sorghi]
MSKARRPNLLRQMQRELKNKDDDRRKELQRDLNMAKAIHSSCPSDATKAELDTAKAELLSLDEYFTSSREKAKFDRDVSEGERVDGEMAAEHREYWGTIYQSPSNDLRDSIPMRRYDPMRMQDLLRYTEKRLTEAQ